MISFLKAVSEKRNIENIIDEDFKSCRFAASKDEGESFSEWCDLSEDDQTLKEKLYLGSRKCLETILTRNNKSKLKDFQELPETARWKMRNIDGILVPSLEDRSNVYVLMPDSGNIGPILKSISMPDPTASGPAGMPIPRDYCEDVWFEECEDGGVYVVGIDDEVVIFYLDVPGDKIYGKYKCSKSYWESIWLNTFGSCSVNSSNMEKLYIEKVTDEEFKSCRFAASKDEGESFSEWCELSEDDQTLKEKLYLGSRKCLETILTRNNKNKLKDFQELPETARWKMRNIDGILVPSLEDRSNVYVLMPDSGNIGPILKSISMPDPTASGPAGMPIPRDYCEDVWFEECEDGGVYIVGIDDEVVIFYLDVPGDKIYGKYKCSKSYWESIWLASFPSIKVNPTLFK